MDILLVLLCCGSLVVTTAFGLGVSFVLERFLGGWAYVVGTLLPVVVFTGLYTLYHIWVRANPCEPIGSLACGEPFFPAFFLFVAVAFVVLIANILAQTSLYLALYGRRQTLPAAMYENAEQEPPPTAAEEMQDPMSAAESAYAVSEQTGFAVSEQTEPVAMPAEQEIYVEETDFSGVPPDAPEEEPPSRTNS